MLAKQLKMSLLQVFSEMTTQRSGFGQKSCVADEQACVFGSFVFKVGDNSLIIHKSPYHLFSVLISKRSFSANEENIR